MARTKSSKPSLEASPRHLWLASLGLAAMTGKWAGRAAGRAADRAQQTRVSAKAMAESVQLRAIDAVGDVRERLQAGVTQLNATVDAAVSPLVARLRPAKAKRAVRRGRKPTTKSARRVSANKKPAVRRSRRG